MPGRLPGPLWGKLLVAAVIIALSVLIILQSGANSTFSSAHEAARHALDRYNPVSIGENREYGGYIFRTSGGRFGYTSPTRGDFGHMIFDPPNKAVPEETAAVALWHTHGATLPDVISETFSPQDIKLLRQFAVDGYLATPSGQFKFYDLANSDVQLLGRVSTAR